MWGGEKKNPETKPKPISKEKMSPSILLSTLMDISDGPAAGSLSNHSGLTAWSLTTPSCLTSVATALWRSHPHKLALQRVHAGIEVLIWRKQDSEAAATAMSSTSDRISQSNSVDPRFLLRLTLHWAVSLRWREWWMDSLFILSHSKQHRQEKDLTNTQIWLFWHVARWC